MKTITTMFLVLAVLCGTVFAEETPHYPTSTLDFSMEEDSYAGRMLRLANPRNLAGDMGFTDSLRQAMNINGQSLIQVKVSLNPAWVKDPAEGVQVSGNLEILNNPSDWVNGKRAYRLRFGVLKGRSGEYGLTPLVPVPTGAEVINTLQGDTITAEGSLDQTAMHFPAVEIPASVYRVNYSFTVNLTAEEYEWYENGRLSYELIAHVEEVGSYLSNMGTSVIEIPVGEGVQMSWSQDHPILRFYLQPDPAVSVYLLSVSSRGDQYFLDTSMNWVQVSGDVYQNRVPFVDSFNLQSMVNPDPIALESVNLPPFYPEDEFTVLCAVERADGSLLISNILEKQMPAEPEETCLYVTSPASAPYYTNADSVLFEGTVGTTVDAVSVSYTVNGSETNYADLGTTGDTQTWSFYYDFSEDGEYNFTISAESIDGLVCHTTRKVVRDTQLPVIGILTPEGDVSTTTDTYVVKGFALDEITGVERVTAEIPGDAGTTELTLDGDRFEFTVALGSGANTIKVGAYDKAGNDNYATRVITLVGDGGTTGDTGGTTTPNTAPVAADWNYSSNIYTNSTYSFTSAQILEHVTDADGDDLTITRVDEASSRGGSVTLTDTGIRYISPITAGVDTVTYYVTDGTATVSGKILLPVSVYSGGGSSGGGGSNPTPPAPTNNGPTAVDDSANTVAGAVKSISVLLNDSDPEGDTLTITNVSAPTGGAAVINGSNIDYTAPAGAGVYTFTYTISDGNGHSDTATVTVTVVANTAPTATVADTTIIGFVGDSPVTLDGSGSSDPESANGDFITYAWTTPDAEVTITNANAATPTIDVSTAGSYTVTLTVTDSGGLSDTETVYLEYAGTVQLNGTSGEVYTLTKGHADGAFVGDGSKVNVSGTSLQYAAQGSGTLTYTSGDPNLGGGTAQKTITVTNDNAPGSNAGAEVLAITLRPSTATDTLEVQVQNGGDANASRQVVSFSLNTLDTAGNAAPVRITQITDDGGVVATPNGYTGSVTVGVDSVVKATVERTGPPVAGALSVVEGTITLYDQGDPTKTTTRDAVVRVFLND